MQPDLHQHPRAMIRALIGRVRAEPLRMTALAFLFTVTMLAAVVLPRQMRDALEATMTEANVAPPVVHVDSRPAF
jgi:hypothetical protein